MPRRGWPNKNISSTGGSTEPEKGSTRQGEEAIDATKGCPHPTSCCKGEASSQTCSQTTAPKTCRCPCWSVEGWPRSWSYRRQHWGMADWGESPGDRGLLLWPEGDTMRRDHHSPERRRIHGAGNESAGEPRGGDCEVGDCEPRGRLASSPMPGRLPLGTRRRRHSSCSEASAPSRGAPQLGKEPSGRSGRAVSLEGKAKRSRGEEERRSQGRGSQKEGEKKQEQEKAPPCIKVEEVREEGKGQGQGSEEPGEVEVLLEQQPGKQPASRLQEGEDLRSQEAESGLWRHRLGSRPIEEKENQEEGEAHDPQEEDIVEFIQGVYREFLAESGRGGVRRGSQGEEGSNERTRLVDLERPQQHAAESPESPGRKLGSRAGPHPAFGDVLLPASSRPEAEWRDKPRSAHVGLHSRSTPQRSNRFGDRCSDPTIKIVGDECRPGPLEHLTEIRACSKRALPASVQAGSERRSKRESERVESLWRKRRPGSRKGNEVGSQLQRCRSVERQREVQEREGQGWFERSPKGRQEEGGLMKGEEESPDAAKMPRSLEDDALSRSDETARSLVETDSFHLTLQEAIGVVVDCVRRPSPLHAKSFELGVGKKFGDLVPWLVLGLSATHAELCKSLTTGEILPLPLDTPFKLAEVSKAPSSVQFILLGLICGVNSLYGHGVRWTGELNPMQVRVVRFLLEESERFESLGCEFSEVDWKSFFNVRGIDYKGEEVRLAQFTSWGNVSPALPREIGQVDLLEVCEKGCKEYVRRFEDYLLSPDMMVATKPPRVMVDDTSWPEMCQGLLEAGVCELIDEEDVFRVDGSLVLNGLFGVPKDEEAAGVPVHRLIMNLIPVNNLCRPIEGDTSTLPAWPSMSPLFLQPTETLLVSSEDVRCFFYIFRTPPSWRKFMAFNKAVPSSVTGLPSKTKYLTARVLPMGFRNSVAIAQHVHRFIVQESLRRQVSGSRLLGGESEHRRDRPFSSANPTFRVYLDNYDELEKVDKSMAELVRGAPSINTLHLQEVYSRLGVPRHPKKAVSRASVAEVQGALVDGDQGSATPKPDKIKKYVALTISLLKKGVAKQKEVQVVAGGLVYMSMFRRPLLGSLNAVWVFIENFREQPEGLALVIPDGVKSELFRFLCLIPLARMDFRCPLNSCVTASDASSTGGGLSRSIGLSPWGHIAATYPVRGDLVEEMDVTTVLTIGLFDGIGALRVAADAIGLPVVGHVSVEPHGPASRVVEGHFPSSVLVSRVEDVTEELVLQWSCRFSQVGLVIVGGGPPCQGVSGLNADRRGALKDHRSSLHTHVSRIYHLVKGKFTWAQVHYLMESVKSMDQKDRVIMSREIGSTPKAIDSAGVTLCRRPRLYWLSWELLASEGVTLREEQGSGWEALQEVLLQASVDSTRLLEEGWQLEEGVRLPTFTTSRPRSHPGRRPAGQEHCNAHELQRWEDDSYRYPPYQYKDCNCLFNRNKTRRLPSIEEKEVIMGFPRGYTWCCFPKSQANSQAHLDERHSLIGNSWNVFVVAWLLHELCHVLGLVPRRTVQDLVEQAAPVEGASCRGTWADHCAAEPANQGNTGTRVRTSSEAVRHGLYERGGHPPAISKRRYLEVPQIAREPTRKAMEVEGCVWMALARQPRTHQFPWTESRAHIGSLAVVEAKVHAVSLRPYGWLPGLLALPG